MYPRHDVTHRRYHLISAYGGEEEEAGNVQYCFSHYPRELLTRKLGAPK